MQALYFWFIFVSGGVIHCVCIYTYLISLIYHLPY